ncbi:unnamed protein product, partial [Amoebophrya sp. A120]
ADGADAKSRSPPSYNSPHRTSTTTSTKTTSKRNTKVFEFENGADELTYAFLKQSSCIEYLQLESQNTVSETNKFKRLITEAGVCTTSETWTRSEEEGLQVAHMAYNRFLFYKRDQDEKEKLKLQEELQREKLRKRLEHQSAAEKNPPWKEHQHKNHNTMPNLLEKDEPFTFSLHQDVRREVVEPEQQRKPSKEVRFFTEPAMDHHLHIVQEPPQQLLARGEDGFNTVSCVEGSKKLDCGAVIIPGSTTSTSTSYYSAADPPPGAAGPLLLHEEHKSLHQNCHNKVDDLMADLKSISKRNETLHLTPSEEMDAESCLLDLQLPFPRQITGSTAAPASSIATFRSTNAHNSSPHDPGGPPCSSTSRDPRVGGATRTLRRTSTSDNFLAAEDDESGRNG